jgi:hypothetical protein
MSDHDVIFREVDEELRRERMRSLWRRFGPYVIGAAVVVVLVVAVNEGWTWWRNNSAAHASDQFYAALKLSDGGDLAGAKAALDKIVAEGGGYGTLARFKQAAMLAKEGKPADAVAAYDALAGDEANVRLRELALVLAADILVDSGSLSDVESRVSSLVTTDNPMRNAAREAVGLAQYKAGDLEAARKTFEEVAADPMAQGELQSRMQIYLAQITAEAGAAAGSTVSPTDTAPAADTPAPSDEAPAAQPAAPAEQSATPAEQPAPAPAAQPATPAAPAADAPATDAPAADQPLDGAASMMQMMAPTQQETAPAPQEAAPAAPSTPAEQPAPAAGN